MSKFNKALESTKLIPDMESIKWNSINAEYVARMRYQNQFKTGIDIAKFAQLNDRIEVNLITEGIYCMTFICEEIPFDV